MAVEQCSRLDRGLRELAQLAAAAVTGCSSCAGSAYWAPAMRSLVLEEIRAVPWWSDGEVFTRLERLVMLYAEAMAMTPPLPADALAADLRERLGDAGLAELTAVVAESAGQAAGQPPGRAAGGAGGQTGQTGLD
jgi:alkylhydroperoxidase family enzyme